MSRLYQFPPSRLLIILALLCSACASLPILQAASGPVEVKVLTLPFISFAPFQIGLEEGYFAEQGLEIELVNMTQNQETLPALLSGEVDVAAGLTSAGILNTIARGGEVKIVADKGYIDPNGCDNIALLMRKDLIPGDEPVEAELLAGKTIEVVDASWNEYFLEKELNTIGLTIADIKKTHMPSPAHSEAMKQGTLDALINNEPWISRIMQDGHQPVLVPVTQLLPNSASAITFFGPTMYAKGQDVGNRFMLAYLQAVRQYNEGKTDRNVEILAQYNDLEPEVLREMCWPTLRADGQLNVESVLDFQDWAIAAGYIEQPVEPEQFWDPSFIEYANEALANTD